MTLFFALIVVALILAILSVFLPDKRLCRISVILVCVALLLSNTGK